MKSFNIIGKIKEDLTPFVYYDVPESKKDEILGRSVYIIESIEEREWVFVAELFDWYEQIGFEMQFRSMEKLQAYLEKFPETIVERMERVEKEPKK